MISRLIIGCLEIFALVGFFGCLFLGAVIGRYNGGASGTIIGLLAGFVVAVIAMGVLFLLLEINRNLREVRSILEQPSEPEDDTRNEPQVLF